jgi:DNA repair exonuclease SbcCD ATPase subunit
MLSLEYVKFKNFLSFGSKMQEVPFNDGINIVLGYDKDNDKSNGAGKSSFLETIPFALYGQIHKDVKQEDIINWKNRKSCLVELSFSKGEKRYIVKRGIKPKIFDIYEDGILIDKPAHSRDYQAILENIVGLNFQTFMSLVHTNINSSTPVLAMSKPDKRKFIEKIFGLELYSLLNDLANSKLKTINDTVRESEIKIESNNSRINDITSTISTLKLKINQESNTDKLLKEKRVILNELLEKTKGSKEELLDLKDDILNLETKSARLNLIIERISNKNINNVKYKLLNPISTKLSELLTLKKKYDDSISLIKELDKLRKEHTSLKVLEGIMDEKNESISSYDEKRFKIKNEKIQIDSEIQSLSKEIKSIESQVNSLQKDSICPTCGQKIKDIPVEQVELLKYSIEEKRNELINKEKPSKELEIELVEIEKILEKLKKERSDTKKIYDKMASIEREVSSIIEVKKEELDDLIKKSDKYKSVIESLLKEKERLLKEKSHTDNGISFSLERQRDIEYQFRKIEEVNNEIGLLKEREKLEEKNRKEIQELLDNQKKTLDIVNYETRSLKNNIQSKQKMVDYLDTIKWMCKDENIKKFAISYKMPYLNSRVNHYLSEVGYGFYAVIDKWLDTIIKAPGIPNGSYGSLSGGEARGIDLALQFAIHDIARLQSGVWPDTIVMDEVLDSSIDSKGIEKIMGIIKAKQIEQNNKIFIISHREEMDQFEPDNIYFVEKSDGYSKVTIK